MEGTQSSTKKTVPTVGEIPAGDNPYAHAKHFQVVEKDVEAAILWYWKAIYAGDRVDSALKDMACAMKQQNRAEEAIEAIRCLRHLCSKQSQQSLDNILLDLYKKCRRFDAQIPLLKQKLRSISIGEAFNGKTTKTARSHGSKFRVSIKQETARVLGDLGWAYMHRNNYDAAITVYRSAQLVNPDAIKACGLGQCLMKKGQFDEAWRVLEDVVLRRLTTSLISEESVRRAEELMREIEEVRRKESSVFSCLEIGMRRSSEEIVDRLDIVMNEWTPFRSRRLPVFEEISSLRDQMTC